jgi:hypothetical protein
MRLAAWAGERPLQASVPRRGRTGNDQHLRSLALDCRDRRCNGWWLENLAYGLEDVGRAWFRTEKANATRSSSAPAGCHKRKAPPTAASSSCLFRRRFPVPAWLPRRFNSEDSKLPRSAPGCGESLPTATTTPQPGGHRVKSAPFPRCISVPRSSPRATQRASLPLRHSE